MHVRDIHVHVLDWCFEPLPDFSGFSSREVIVRWLDVSLCLVAIPASYLWVSWWSPDFDSDSLIVCCDNLVMHSHAQLVYYIILCLLLLGFTLFRPYHQSSAIGHCYRFCSALKYWSVMFVCSTDCSGFLCVLKPIVTDQGLKLILCYFSILHRLLIICYVTFLELNFILGKWFWQ